MTFTKETCPDRDKHSPQPEGYLQWHAWADKMKRTHRQIRCPTCGLYAIVVPRDAIRKHDEGAQEQ